MNPSSAVTLWDFDSPTATQPCCGSNVDITILSTVTNGACPQVWTRTWLATDCFSHTATCSQSVTVLHDTTMPGITCPENITAGHAAVRFRYSIPLPW